jgi:outer membrane protein assembly factor BamB
MQRSFAVVCALWLGTAAPAADPPLPKGTIARLGSPRMRSQSGYSNGLQFSPRGTAVVLAAGNDALWWFDPATGAARHRHDYPVKEIRCGRLHDDGTLTLFHMKGQDAAAFYYVSRFDPAKGKIVSEVRVPISSADEAAFDPLARRVAVRREKAVTVFDAATGEPLWTETLAAAPDLGPAFVGDGSKVFVVADGVLRLYAAADKKKAVVLDDPAPGRERMEAYNHVAGSADGRLVAATYRQQRVIVWDAATGKIRHSFDKQKSVLGFTSDGSRLLTATDNDTAAVWTLDTGAKDREFPLPAADRAILSPDGKRLATQLHDAVLLHDVSPTGEAKLAPASADVPGLPDLLRFDADGSVVGRLPDWGGWVVWTDRTPRGELLRPFAAGTVHGLSADRKRFLTLDAGTFVVGGAKGPGGTKFISDVPGGAAAHVAALSADGTAAVTAHNDGLTRFDVTTGRSRLIRSPFPDRGGGLVAAVSAAGRVAATEGYDAVTDARYVEVYSLAKDAAVRSVRTPGPAERLELTPDGSRLAVAFTTSDTESNVKKNLLVLEAETGTALLKLGPAAKDEGSPFALSTDGRTAVWQDRNELHVYELLTGQVRAKLPMSRPVHALALAGDGRTLAAAAAGWPVIMWDIAGGATFAPLTAEEWPAAWEQFAKPDGVKAYQFARRMHATPAEAVAFLKAKLTPAAPPDPAVLAKWIGKLDAPAFADRQRAVKELRSLGELAVPELRRVLETTESAEVRERIEKLLSADAKPTPDAVRSARAVEVLEWIGTPAAKAALKAAAAGAEGSRQTREAAAALARMK